jgi:hypothetical protein
MLANINSLQSVQSNEQTSSMTITTLHKKRQNQPSQVSIEIIEQRTMVVNILIASFSCTNRKDLFWNKSNTILYPLPHNNSMDI